MSRIATLTLAALLVLGVSPKVQAQACAGTSVSQTCAWSATVTVQAVLSCAVTQNFDFGSHPSSVGSVEGNETNTGRIVCSTNPGSAVNVSFTLPNTLSDGHGHTVAITYGTGSARLYPCATSCGTPVEFSPANGFVGFATASGNVLLALGENGPNDPSAGVFVNLAGAAAGTYTGTITATIALQ